MKKAIFWFRRDLRTSDNTALIRAVEAGYQILPIFIFDQHIIDTLPKSDARVNFIYSRLLDLNNSLVERGGQLLILHGDAKTIIDELCDKYHIEAVYSNEDYEPYAIKRDKQVRDMLESKSIQFIQFTDHVIFKPGTITKGDGLPYTVYTPFKNKWLESFNKRDHSPQGTPKITFLQHNESTPSLRQMGFTESDIAVPQINWSALDQYGELRDFPARQHTSFLGTHLRFGTISPRQVIDRLSDRHVVFLSELVWREFFIQILYHFPHVIGSSFRPAYDHIEWRNDESEFESWCNGETGYPLVDAGMRELNTTGLMHNRVRMVTASFLCKHLLIDWRWGEAYFAQKLLDYELASNNGNWQWAAGTGCDAAPYFRVFNPSAQVQKFDSDLKYVRKWVPEIDQFGYSPAIVEHSFARKRAIDTYKSALDDFRSNNDISSTVNNNMPIA